MGRDRNEPRRAASTNGDVSGYDTNWIEPSERTIADVKARLVTGETWVWGTLGEMVEAGWKLSINWSDHYGGVIVSGTCKDKAHAYYKKVFLVQHVEYTKAVALLMHIFEAEGLADGEYLTAESKAASW